MVGIGKRWYGTVWNGMKYCYISSFDKIIALGLVYIFLLLRNCGSLQDHIGSCICLLWFLFALDFIWIFCILQFVVSYFLWIFFHMSILFHLSLISTLCSCRWGCTLPASVKAWHFCSAPNQPEQNFAGASLCRVTLI